jgi:hypothetical protein
VRRLLLLGLLAAPLLLLAAEPLAAQCAMCQTALINSAEGRAIGQEFNRAILLMLFAPYLVFASIGVVLMRHRIGVSLGSSLRRRLAAFRSPVAPPPAPRVH